MRIGMWAAAAAATMLGAGQAGAATTVITQSAFSSFQPHGSSGPAPIGGLNLSAGMSIVSATFSYTYSGSVSQQFANLFNINPVTYTYGGNAGWAVYGLPVPFYASSSASGTVPCASNSCDAGISSTETMDVPLADLAAFAGPAPLVFTAIGQMTGTVDQANSLALQTSGFAYNASGTMTYILGDGAVPEPATWGMMILGIALAGALLRRQRHQLPGQLSMA